MRRRRSADMQHHLESAPTTTSGRERTAARELSKEEVDLIDFLVEQAVKAWLTIR